MNNPWINYADRSYQKIKQDIIDKIKNPLTGIPEIKDTSEGNDFIKMVGIWSGIAEQIGYYLNKKTRESFLATCRMYSSAVAHADSQDYRVRGLVASTGTVTFTIPETAPSAVVIPLGTIVKTNTEVEFVTLNEVSIGIGETEVDADVKQWTLVPEFIWGNSTGEQNIEIELGDDIEDSSIYVRVGASDIFTKVDTFAFSKLEDKVYRPSMNEDGNMVIKFGDNITGAIPQSAAEINLSYYRTLGLDGNVSAQKILEVVSSISLPPGVSSISVINNSNTNGGSNIESLNELKTNIPLSIRTKMRAVTDQDYIDIAKLAPGVANADQEYSAESGVYIYVVPVGGGIAGTVLLEGVEFFFEDKRLVQTKITGFSAGEVRLTIEAIINVKTGYNRSFVVDDVKTNLLLLLSWENALINGELFISDLYQTIEETDGVLNSQITNTGIIPYARPSSRDVIELNWVIQVVDAGDSTTIYGVQFINANDYNLFRGSAFLGVFSVDNEVDVDSVIFTIYSDSYVLDYQYTFITYPDPDFNTGKITLQEKSIIISYNEDILLTGVGGSS